MSVRSGRRDGTASADACVVVDIVGACLLLLDDDVVVVFLIQLLLFRFKRVFFWHQYIFSIIHPFTYLFCLIQYGDFFFRWQRVLIRKWLMKFFQLLSFVEPTTLIPPYRPFSTRVLLPSIVFQNPAARCLNYFPISRQSCTRTRHYTYITLFV